MYLIQYILLVCASCRTDNHSAMASEQNTQPLAELQLGSGASALPRRLFLEPNAKPTAHHFHQKTVDTSSLLDAMESITSLPPHFRSAKGSLHSKAQNEKYTTTSTPIVYEVINHRINYFLATGWLIVIVMLLGNMVPQGHRTRHGGTQASNIGTRMPPAWDSNNPDRPFRAWMQDVIRWSMASEMSNHQQAIAITEVLGGTAEEMARTLSPEELML